MRRPGRSAIVVRGTLAGLAALACVAGTGDATAADPPGLGTLTLGLDAFGSIQPDQTVDDRTPPSDLAFELGWGFGARIGAYAFPGLRFELDGQYAESPVDTLSQAGAGSLEIDGSVRFFGGFLNAVYEVDAGQGFRPYIGIGAGYGDLDASGEVTAGGTTTELTSDSAGVFVGQLSAGIGYAVTPELLLTLGYRYQRSEEATFETTAAARSAAGVSDTVDLRWEAHQIGVGLTWQFGAGIGDGRSRGLADVYGGRGSATAVTDRADVRRGATLPAGAPGAGDFADTLRGDLPRSGGADVAVAYPPPVPAPVRRAPSVSVATTSGLAAPVAVPGDETAAMQAELDRLRLRIAALEGQQRGASVAPPTAAARTAGGGFQTTRSGARVPRAAQAPSRSARRTSQLAELERLTDEMTALTAEMNGSAPRGRGASAPAVEGLTDADRLPRLPAVAFDPSVGADPARAVFAPDVDGGFEAAAATDGAGWAVQLASVRSNADARSRWDGLVEQFPVLTATELRVERAEVGSRGTFHRVQAVPAGGGVFAEKADAAALCRSVAAGGGDCLVARVRGGVAGADTAAR